MRTYQEYLEGFGFFGEPNEAQLYDAKVKNLLKEIEDWIADLRQFSGKLTNITQRERLMQICGSLNNLHQLISTAN